MSGMRRLNSHIGRVVGVQRIGCKNGGNLASRRCSSWLSVRQRPKQQASNIHRSLSTSISSDEVAKFSGMNDAWWDAKQNPLVGMNPVRVSFIRQVVAEVAQKETKGKLPFEGLQALDIGCGGGLLSESLARLGADVTGVDPSTALVERAIQHAQMDPRTRSIKYLAGMGVEDLESAYNDSMDIVCLLEVVEHTPDLPRLLQEACRVLKAETGVLFVSTMNKTLKSHLVTIVGAEYVMGYLPVGTHNWNQYQSPQDIQSLLEVHQVHPVRVSGMVLSEPPLCQWKWHLDPRDTDVNWIGAYRKPGAS